MKKRPDPEDFRMSFGDHLEDLRRRIIFALLGVAVIFGFTLYYGRTLIAWLYLPLAVVQRLAHLPTHAYTRSTFSGFTIYLKVAIIAAVIIAAPWVFYQLWKFVEAGLYATERKAVIWLVSLSSAMTVCGLAFMYFFFLPAMLAFFVFWDISYPVIPGRSPYFEAITRRFIDINASTLIPTTPTVEGASTTAPAAPAGPLRINVLEEDPPAPYEGQLWYNKSINELRFFSSGQIQVLAMSVPSMIIPLLDPNEYLNQVAILALVVVLVFQIPVAMAFLGMVGIGNPDWLAKRRRLLIMGFFVAAVFITPSQDVFSNVVLPLLIWGLFEFGLILMRLFARQRNKRRAAAEAAEAAEEADKLM